MGVLAFTTIPEQPFPLPHYCGISDPPGVASAAKTSVSLMGKDHEYRANRP
jgi:hypothetical protein